jgi:hypothetical protein
MSQNISRGDVERFLGERPDLGENLNYQVRILYEFSDFTRFPIGYSLRLVQASNRNSNSKRFKGFGGLSRLIGFRIFNEHAEIEARELNPSTYSSEAFKDYVDRETHYALERLKGKDKLHEVTQEDYERTLGEVFDAIVGRAVELFSIHGSHDCPIDPNDVNTLLRVDLRDYIWKNQESAVGEPQSA